jgi:hypothetical protein
MAKSTKKKSSPTAPDNKKSASWLASKTLYPQPTGYKKGGKKK